MCTFTQQIGKGMIALLLCASIFAPVGCGAPPAAIDWPKEPLCFVEEMPNEEVFERLGRLTPLAADRVLMVPVFGQGAGRGDELVIARPFLYKPGEPLVIPTYQQGYGFREIVAVCEGFLPSRIPRAFYYTDTITGKKCQLVPLWPAHTPERARRVLDDFAYLFSQASVAVHRTIDPYAPEAVDEHRYALASQFSTKAFSKYKIEQLCGVWSYDAGTRLRVDVTAEEKEAIAKFLGRPIPDARPHKPE